MSRSVVYLPPVLVLTVFDLVQMGHLSSDVTTYSKHIRVGHLSYRLAGVTLHKGDHFTGALNITRNGWLFYDGLDGNLKGLNNSMLTGNTPIQAVYVIYEKQSILFATTENRV